MPAKAATCKKVRTEERHHLRTNEVRPDPWIRVFKFCPIGCAQNEIWLPAGCGGLDPGTLCLWADHKGQRHLCCQTPPWWEVLNPRNPQGGKDVRSPRSTLLFTNKKTRDRNTKCLLQGHTSY